MSNERGVSTLRTMIDNDRIFRMVVESSPSVILMVSAAGRIVLANAEAHRQFGYGPGEMAALTVEQLVPAQFRGNHPSLRRDFGRDPQARPMGAGRDLFGLRKDGSEFPVEIGLNAFDTPDGKVVLCTIVDITRRKEAEAALHESEEKLRQAQKLDAAGRLAGGIAHDYNNILSTILLNTDVLKETLASDPDSLKELALIENVAHRGSALTRQLLAFSRAQVLKLEVLDLNQVIGDTAKMLQRLIGEDIELEIHADPDLGRVNADKSQMEQILMNLMINAREAMPSGGKMFIETKPVHLSDEDRGIDFDLKPGQYAMMVVEDNGIGMDKDTLARIFEPFFTTKEKGTGLGLPTVYGIVKQCNGSIKVYSEPRKGTTFKIVLPCIADKSRPDRRKALQADTIHGQGKILLVEDDESLRSTITRLLEKFGFAVTACATDREALAAARDPGGDFRLMISDVILPQKTGPALFKEIAGMHPHLRVLFISGYTDRIAREYGDILTADNFLQKPFSTGQLSEKLRQVLTEESYGR